MTHPDQPFDWDSLCPWCWGDKRECCHIKVEITEGTNVAS